MNWKLLLLWFFFFYAFLWSVITQANSVACSCSFKSLGVFFGADICYFCVPVFNNLQGGAGWTCTCTGWRGSTDTRPCLLDVHLNTISLELTPVQRNFDWPVTLITHVRIFPSSSLITLTCCTPDPSLSLCLAGLSLLPLLYYHTFCSTLATFPFLHLAVLSATIRKHLLTTWNMSHLPVPASMSA